MTKLKTSNIGRTIIDSVKFSDQGNLAVSLSEVKNWLKVDGTALDSEIGSLMDDVLDEMMRISNRSLVSQTVTVLFSQYGREVKLPYSPVNSITSVKKLEKGEETVLSEDEYYKQGNSIFIDTLDNSALEVIYKAGEAMPKGLRGAFLQACETTFTDRGDNVLGSVVSIPTNSRKRALRYKEY